MGAHNRSETLSWRLRQSLACKDTVIICVLLIAGFLLKILPIMKYPRIGGDPFVHFRYAMALLDGKLSAPVEVNGPATVELYYPPLFHLISLGFFLAFPIIDPYSIMKSLAVTFGILQIVPIYLIVRRITHWSPAALLASYSLLSVRSDYQMLSWGDTRISWGCF